jgi:hypothetical protein
MVPNRQRAAPGEGAGASAHQRFDEPFHAPPGGDDRRAPIA